MKNVIVAIALFFGSITAAQADVDTVKDAALIGGATGAAVGAAAGATSVGTTMAFGIAGTSGIAAAVGGGAGTAAGVAMGATIVALPAAIIAGVGTAAYFGGKWLINKYKDKE